MGLFNSNMQGSNRYSATRNTAFTVNVGNIMVPLDLVFTGNQYHDASGQYKVPAGEGGLYRAYFFGGLQTGTAGAVWYPAVAVNNALLAYCGYGPFVGATGEMKGDSVDISVNAGDLIGPMMNPGGTARAIWPGIAHFRFSVERIA